MLKIKWIKILFLQKIRINSRDSMMDEKQLQINIHIHASFICVFFFTKFKIRNARKIKLLLTNLNMNYYKI